MDDTFEQQISDLESDQPLSDTFRPRLIDLLIDLEVRIKRLERGVLTPTGSEMANKGNDFMDRPS